MIVSVPVGMHGLPENEGDAAGTLGIRQFYGLYRAAILAGKLDSLTRAAISTIQYLFARRHLNALAFGPLRKSC